MGGGRGLDPRDDNTAGLLLGGAAVAVVVLAGALWFAKAVDAALAHQPGPPQLFAYLFGLVSGRQDPPGLVGWVVLAAVLVMGVGVGVLVVGLVLRRLRRKPRVDKTTRHLAPVEHRRSMNEQARRIEAQRLAPQVTGIVGTLYGLSVPGNEPVYSGAEDVQIDIWGPRLGKTSTRAIPAVVGAPGAVIATSNRRDLLDCTILTRSKVGRTWVFDPQKIATDGRPTFIYNPLRRVTDVVNAQKLASIFEAASSEAGAQRSSHWDTAGRDLLAWMFLAAGSGGRPIGVIIDWLNDSRPDEPLRLLTEAGHLGPRKAVQGILDQPEKMRGSVFGTAQRMARPLINPDLLAWIEPNPSLPEFDPSTLANSRDTLYAVSKEGEGSAGAVVAAITAECCEEAEQIASTNKNGRLTVPLLACLDEAANICRWPALPAQFSHYGGRAILLMVFLQSWTQGVEAWGENGMRTMWSAATGRVYGGGVADSKFLAELSELIGDHDEQVKGRSYGAGGTSTSWNVRKERTLSVAELANLERGRAILLSAGRRPMLIAPQPWMVGPYAAEIQASKDAQEARIGTASPSAGADPARQTLTWTAPGTDRSTPR